MSFIYTRCAAAKACPYATGVLMQLHRVSAEDAALARSLRLVSMSFDPANDTPERMAAYSALARSAQAAAPWHFRHDGVAGEAQPILDAYGQAVDRKPSERPDRPADSHTAGLSSSIATGNIRNIYSSGTLDLRLVLADVNTLLMEETKLPKP